MRLQHVAVMFVLIFIPIILVTSYFISLQVRTIKLETSYNEKLINATYDAMTAFELNTANEDLSSVSDSLRSIIDASNNIFFNTLCTNFGISNASKSYIQPYIPAILYTLYDGYYIYAPTNIPEVCVDDFGNTMRVGGYGVTGGSTISGTNIGVYNFDKSTIVYSKYNSAEFAPEYPEDPNENTQTAAYLNYDDLTNKEEYNQILYKNNDGTYSTQLHTISGNHAKSTYYKRDYILKSYIPYSVRYEKGSTNITVNYTLDNFITLEGSIGNVYYTKSGYLINPDLVQKIEVGPAGGAVTKTIQKANWMDYAQETLDTCIEDQRNQDVKVYLNDGTIISTQDGAISIPKTGGGTEISYWADTKSAVQYYVDSFMFSCWVNANLNGIVPKTDLKTTAYSVGDIQKGVADLDDIDDSQSELLQEMLYNFDEDSSTPFAISSTNDPEKGDSAFYKHKRNVIKNSITYNLMLSMLVFTEESRTTEFNMPVFSEAEWDRVLNNVSITAFMEGMRCGLKYYNHYAIVTSTNNEISITDNEIYYLPRARQVSGVWYLNYIDNKAYVENDANPIPTAHRIDCPDLVLNASGATSFASKEVKYDKVLKKVDDGITNTYEYEYDHMAYTDYACIVDSNYSVKGAVTGKTYDGNTDILQYLLDNKTDTATKEKLRAYRIAIAKERNNLYKTTAFPDDYGVQVTMSSDEKDSGDTSIAINLSGTYDIRMIKKIEVTIEEAGIKDSSGNDVYGIYTDTITASYDSGFNLDYTYTKLNASGAREENPQTISTTSTSRRTLEYVQDFDFSSATNVSTLYLKTGDSRTVFKVNAVKVYFK